VEYLALIMKQQHHSLVTSRNSLRWRVNGQSWWDRALLQISGRTLCIKLTRPFLDLKQPKIVITFIFCWNAACDCMLKPMPNCT